MTAPKSVIVSSKPITVVRASSSMVNQSSWQDRRLELEDTTDTSGKLTLTCPQSRRLLNFLSIVGVVFDPSTYADSASSPELDSLTSLYPNSELREFVVTTVKACGKASKPEALITWIQLINSSNEDLQKDKPERFRFLLHRDIVSRVKTSSGYRYRKREVARYEFSHGYIGRNSNPLLSSRCDLATLRENPSVRQVHDKGRSSSNEEALQLLMEFFLCPLRELTRVSDGLVRPYAESELTLQENIFKKVKRPAGFFTLKDFVLNSNFDAPALRSIQVESLSLAVQPCFDSLDAPGVKRDALKIHETLNQIVSLHAAIFSSSVQYQGGFISDGGSIISLEKIKRELDPVWISERDDDLLSLLEKSHQANKLQGIKIRVSRPIQKHDKYTIQLKAYNERERSPRNFNRNNDYDRLRRTLLKDGASNVESAEQIAASLENSLELSVTIHPRVLQNDLRLRSVASLRDKIVKDGRGNWNGRTHDFYHEIISQALAAANIPYWTTSLQWMKIAEVDSAAFSKGALRMVTSGWLPSDDHEALAKERLSSLETTVKDLLQNKSLPTLFRKRVHPLFKISEVRDVSYNRVKRVASVPELALLFFIHWYFQPSETLIDLAANSSVFPDEWKYALENPRALGKDTIERRKVGLRLLKDVHAYGRRHFGVDLNVSRNLHKEVKRKMLQVLTNKRTLVADFRSKVDPSATPPITEDDRLAVDWSGMLFSGFSNKDIFRDARYAKVQVSSQGV